MSATIQNPVKLGFDPKRAREDIQTIFQDEIARTLWLAWRSGHITSQYFNFSCWESAQRLKFCAPPISESDIVDCLKGIDFTENDVKRFAKIALPFFTGESKLEFTIIGKG